VCTGTAIPRPRAPAGVSLSDRTRPRWPHPFGTHGRRWRTARSGCTQFVNSDAQSSPARQALAGARPGSTHEAGALAIRAEPAPSSIRCRGSILGARPEPWPAVCRALTPSVCHRRRVEALDLAKQTRSTDPGLGGIASCTSTLPSKEPPRRTRRLQAPVTQLGVVGARYPKCTLLGEAVQIAPGTDPALVVDAATLARLGTTNCSRTLFPRRADRTWKTGGCLSKPGIACRPGSRAVFHATGLLQAAKRADEAASSIRC